MMNCQVRIAFYTHKISFYSFLNLVHHCILTTRAKQAAESKEKMYAF